MKRFGEKDESFDTAYYFASLQVIVYKELIITGAWKPQGLATHVYLLKTDSLGNRIWDNSFNYFNFYNEGHNVAQTTNSGFIIGCEWAGCDTTVGIEERGSVEYWRCGRIRLRTLSIASCQLSIVKVILHPLFFILHWSFTIFSGG